MRDEVRQCQDRLAPETGIADGKEAGCHDDVEAGGSQADWPSKKGVVTGLMNRAFDVSFMTMNTGWKSSFHSNFVQENTTF